MRNSPDRRLRRIARLARLPPDLDLMCPDCIIYCICGPHPPYIWRCGAINGPRPPLDRFCEHWRKGRSLRNKYIGRQCKAHIRAIRLGRLPSLPRLIAKYGMGCMTMYPVERVQPSPAGQRERFWDRVHAPTANQKTPFGGVDRLVWEMISNKRGDSTQMKTLKARAEFILQKGVTHLGIRAVLKFLVDECGHLQTPLFDRLFTEVKRTVRSEWGFVLPRRLTFQVPLYEPHIHARVRRFIINRLSSFCIPTALRDWLCQSVNIVPKSTPSVGDVLKRGPALFTPKIVCKILDQEQSLPPFASWRSFSEQYGMWVVDKFDPATCTRIRQTVRSTVLSLPCSCVTRSRGGPGHGTLRLTRTSKQAGKALRSQGHHYARVM